MDSEQIKREKPDTDRILNIAIEAGHILLENGAEIFRVEETMERIAGHYGVDEKDFFVLTNGIFATGNSFAAVRQISVSSGSRLDKIVAVNRLSREIAEGMYTPAEAEERLERIRNMRDKRPIMQILASGVGSAGFCMLFGGGLRDAAVALAAGIILYIYVLYVANPHLSKIPGNIFGSAVVTLICIVCYRLGFGEGLSHMVIGSIIPLIPGVEFTNGVRDIAYGDYLSGFIRLLDAILVFVSIAIGVGVVFLIYGHAFGGTII
ncbi:MAG: threonine/serine exporter family protein [Butyrivibrio sp.]|nr:threonine/serine exporter family protein [Butyrivibrio sp.]